VNVDTVDGRVTLHGKVSGNTEKERAAEVVRKIDGVREVQNLLQVVPQSQEKAVEVSDDKVKSEVTEILKKDPSLAASRISVESVNNGVVLLAGNADTFIAHLSAVTDAYRVPGVRRVATEVKSPDTVSDAELRRKPTMASSASGGGMASSASDAWITAQTKMRLLADSETPALQINVDTMGGIVTLFGVVASSEQKAAAEANAHKVSGVKSVKNELQVVPAVKQDAVAANDGQIQKAVETAISSRDSLKSAGIGVEVKNGVARLTGDVPSESDRIAAAVVARSTPGVRSVLTDDLRVKAQG
jgi:osmotically-inducible protein OsmY